MIELLREFVGSIPDFTSVYNLPELLEYVFGVGVLFVVMWSLYALLGNIISIFK